jgi:site-specific recombinase XerD
MFAEEKPTLLPLPVEPFRYYQYGERVVHLDGCVEVEAAYYDALLYSKTHKRSYRQDKYRMKPLVEEFGNRVADGIDSPELASWLSTKAEESGWKPATANRFKALLSLTYRLGVESKKVSTNPASRSLKRKLENNARVRFLNQFPPAKTTVDYLKPCVDEESRLRAVIATECPQHMLEFEVALHTGMRPSEQYSLTWDKVDLTRRFVTISHSKNGSARHIPLNSVALAAFKTLQKHAGTAVFVTMRGEPLQGYKHWFDPAVEKAGVKDFTWYCLRHTFASRLVMKGVDLPTVRDFMGHKNIQMTCRYAHLAPDHKQAAVEKRCEAAATTRKTTRERATEKQSVQAIPTDTRTDTTFAPSL